MKNKMDKKFEERLITLETVKGRKARDEVLNRFERVQRKQEIDKEILIAFEELDIQKLGELYKELHGEKPSDNWKKGIEETFAITLEISHMDALLEDSERNNQILHHEKERLRFANKHDAEGGE